MAVVVSERPRGLARLGHGAAVQRVALGALERARVTLRLRVKA